MSRFETIGNATLIIYEGNKNNEPLFATDVWLDENDAYFGSWRLSHKIPTKQREACTFLAAKCLISCKASLNAKEFKPPQSPRSDEIIIYPTRLIGVLACKNGCLYSVWL